MAARVPTNGARILVCDGEPQTFRALKAILRDAGFAVATAASAGEALDGASVRPPDAAIMELVLPDRDGVEVVRSIRAWSDMPILLLSAVAEEAEKVRAFEAGADDYLTKPFGPDEFALLRTLVRNRGRLMTHSDLLREVWGPGYGGDTALLRAHVANLRHKIERDPSKPRYHTTDPRVGYRFAAERTAGP